MIELLRAAADARPDAVAVRNVSGDRPSDVTWLELLTQAEAAATRLNALAVRRFAVLEPNQATVWALLAAASLAGAEACVYPLAAPEDAIAEMQSAFGHDVVVTRRPVGGTVLDSDELVSPGSRTSHQPPAFRPLLVLTTGTSGRPKAVQHDWSRLLRITARISPTPDHRWLLAYGLNQFGGLQILLHVAAAQATAVVPPSFQPRAALGAMVQAGVTHVSGTPTFWRFLLAEMHTAPRNLELQQVTVSGEAVPGALIDRLAVAFPRARISQIYAATEMGTGVTVRDGIAGLPLSVLDDADAEVAFRVVDGELEVRSRAAMLGYYGQDPLPADGWRRTGDLVEVVGDRIEFRGRATDVINVGGVKVHPLTIEDRVARLPNVAVARAYGRPNKLVGSIVALDVVTRGPVDLDALGTAIRAACADLPSAARPRSIQFVDAIETGGNKISRRSTG